MSQNQDPENLDQLLDKIIEAPKEDNDQVTLGEILEVVGRRSFAPMLIVTGV